MKNKNIFFFNTLTEEQSFRQMIPFIDGLEVYGYKTFYNTRCNSDHRNLLESKSTFMNFIDFKKNNADTKALIVCFNIFDVLKVHKQIGKSNNFEIMLRPRGLLPEESFLKSKSYIRKYILNFIEKKAMKKSDYYCFISNNQRTHFYSKYNNLLKNKKNLIIRNYKDNINLLPNQQKVTNKNLRVVYSGGFSEWQNIEKIFEMLKKLESEIKYIDFYIYTFQKNHDLAWEYVRKFKLQSKVHVEYHPQSRLEAELMKNDIGLLMRENNIVNMAASPFKIVDYISAGLAVVVTDNIGDYSDILTNKNYAHLYKYEKDFSESQLKGIADFINNYKKWKEVYKKEIAADYKNIFSMKNEIKILNSFIQEL